MTKRTQRTQRTTMGEDQQRYTLNRGVLSRRMRASANYLQTGETRDNIVLCPSSFSPLPQPAGMQISTTHAMCKPGSLTLVGTVLLWGRLTLPWKSPDASFPSSEFLRGVPHSQPLPCCWFAPILHKPRGQVQHPPIPADPLSEALLWYAGGHDRSQLRIFLVFATMTQRAQHAFSKTG